MSAPKHSVIQVPTQELSEKVQKFLFEQGYIWLNGSTEVDLSAIRKYNEDACISLNHDNKKQIGYSPLEFYKQNFPDLEFFNAATEFDKFEAYIKGESMDNKNSKNFNVYYKPSSQSDAIAAMYILMDHYKKGVQTGKTPIEYAKKYNDIENSNWYGVSSDYVTSWYGKPDWDKNAICIDTNLTDLVAALKGEYLVEPPAPEIYGYKGKIVAPNDDIVGAGISNSKIVFGCAEISLSMINEVDGFMKHSLGGNRTIQSITLDSGKVLTRQNISDILDYVNKYWEYQKKKNINENR